MLTLTQIRTLEAKIESMELEEIVQVNEDGSKITRNSGMVKKDDVIKLLYAYRK